MVVNLAQAPLVPLKSFNASQRQHQVDTHRSGAAYFDKNGNLKIDKEPLQITHFHFNRRMYDKVMQEPTEFDNAITALMQHNLVQTISSTIGTVGAPPIASIPTYAHGPPAQAVSRPRLTDLGMGMNPHSQNARNAERRVSNRSQPSHPASGPSRSHYAPPPRRHDDDRREYYRPRPRSPRSRSRSRSRFENERMRSRSPRSDYRRHSRRSPTTSPIRRDPSPPPRIPTPPLAQDDGALNGGRVDVASNEAPVTPLPNLEKLSLLERIEGAMLTKPDSTWGNHAVAANEPTAVIGKIPKKKKKRSKAKARPVAEDNLPLESVPSNLLTEDTSAAESVNELFDELIDTSNFAEPDHMAIDEDPFLQDVGSALYADPLGFDDGMGPGFM